MKFRTKSGALYEVDQTHQVVTRIAEHPVVGAHPRMIKSVPYIEVFGIELDSRPVFDLGHDEWLLPEKITEFLEG